jgi:hypothetical protein
MKISGLRGQTNNSQLGANLSQVRQHAPRVLVRLMFELQAKGAQLAMAKWMFAAVGNHE